MDWFQQRRKRVTVLEDEEVSEVSHVVVSTWADLARRNNIPLLLTAGSWILVVITVH